MQYVPSKEEKDTDVVVRGQVEGGVQEQQHAFAFQLEAENNPVVLHATSPGLVAGLSRCVLLRCAAIADGEAADVLLPDGGELTVRRIATSHWIPLGPSRGRAAKRVVFAPTADARNWTQPKFDARLELGYANESCSVVALDPAFDSLLCSAIFPGLSDPALGWEMLATMRKGEVSQFRFPVGAATSERVSQPVTLRSFSNPTEPWETRSASERLATAASLRQEGNAAVAEGRLQHARRKYRRALTFVDRIEHGQEGAAEKAKILLNLAALDIREQQWQSAVTTCDRVMNEVDRRSAKARVRRAKANAELGRLQEASEDVTKLQLQMQTAADHPDGSGQLDLAGDLQRVVALVAKKKAAEDARLLPLAKAILG